MFDGKEDTCWNSDQVSIHYSTVPDTRCRSKSAVADIFFASEQIFGILMKNSPSVGCSGPPVGINLAAQLVSSRK